MTTTPHNRLGLLLRVLRIRAGLDQVELADLLETSQPTVSRWETGGGEPSAGQAAQWLAACAKRSPAVIDDGLVELVDGWYAAQPGPQRERLAACLDRAVLALAGGDNGVYSTVVPYFADIAAGNGEVQERRCHPRRHLGVPREVYERDPDCYALRVTGNSMCPLFQDGDIVVISPRAQLIDGCIVAAYVEPDGDVVKVYREGEAGRVVLEPVNPDYPPLALEPNGGREGRIWGRVVLQQREL